MIIKVIIAKFPHMVPALVVIALDMVTYVQYRCKKRLDKYLDLILLGSCSDKCIRIFFAKECPDVHQQ